MILRALAAGVALATAFLPSSTARAQTATTSSVTEVTAAVERLFAGMRSRDTAALRALLAPDLVIVSSREGSAGGTMRRQSVAQFLQAVATSADTLHERMWAPEVRVDGDLATLWAPYDFHLGSRFSHCGIDAFQLIRRDGTWLITGLAYTVRTTGCRGPR